MEEKQMENAQAESTKIEGRNAVLEAFRSGKTIDKLFVLDGCKDGPIQTILREAKKHDTLVQFVAKERLEQLSETKKHQGVIAMAAAFSYATVEDILENARKKNEAPFVILLDNIEDPQFGCNYPYCQSGRCPWRHYSKAPCSGTDCYGGKGIRRSHLLYTGSKGNQSYQYHPGIKGAGHVVCLCRYGWHNHV